MINKKDFMEKEEFIKTWTSQTMTSTNYIKIKGRNIFYGVVSLDDEQTFNAHCLVEEFIDNTPEWWTKVNFKPEQWKEICDTVTLLILQKDSLEDDQV